MIFLNNSSAGTGGARATGLHYQFGTISRGGGHNGGPQEESDNFVLGCIVTSFGIAITLALILLPLSICCSALIYHPLFVFGAVLFVVLTLFGGVLCLCSSLITRCFWWFSDQDICAKRFRDHQHSTVPEAYRYVIISKENSIRLLCK